MSTTLEQPTMPYTVRELVLNGDGLTRSAKCYADTGVMPFLSDDEVKVLGYVRWLEGERERLMAELDAAELQALVAADAKPKATDADVAAAMVQGAAEGVVDAAKGKQRFAKPR